MLHQTRPVVLITRPHNGAERFAKALLDEFNHKIKIRVSPLTGIEARDQSFDLSDATALIFTSLNGVDEFLRQSARRDIPCYAVGDATAQRARAGGLQAISCKGDSKDLIARILSDKQKGPLFHFRGEHSRGAIAENLIKSGCEIKEVIVYKQVQLMLNNVARTLLERENRVIVPLFSPRGAAQFVKQYKGRAKLEIVAISKDVAEIARTIKPVRVVIAQNPNAKAMISAIKGLFDAG